MSNKFTGITSAGSAIPVYDKDAHEALSAKLDTSAFDDAIASAVSGKADTSAIPSLDGYATQEWVGEQGYLTEVPESAVSGFATHEEVESATSGLQPSGDYATNSAVAAALSSKLDASASGSLPYVGKDQYSTMHVDNYGYIYTTSAAKSPWMIAGDADFIWGNGKTDNTRNVIQLNLASGALYKSGSNNTIMYKFGPAEYSAITAYQQKSGTYLTAVPESAISGKADVSAFELDGNGHISAYNGSAFAGGGATYSAGANIDITDDVISGKDWTEEITSATSGLQPSGDYYSATNPSGFLTELPASATDVIDTVTANSGTWGGSGLPVSAGVGIGIDMVDDTLVFSAKPQLDDTVLWSGDQVGSAFSVTLNDNLNSYRYVYIQGYTNDNNKTRTLDIFGSTAPLEISGGFAMGTSTYTSWGEKFWLLEITNSTITPLGAWERSWGNASAGAITNMNTFGITRVVGFGHK